MDDDRVERARQAVEENRKRLNKVELDQEIILKEYDRYRWLKIIFGIVFVLVILVLLHMVFK